MREGAAGPGLTSGHPAGQPPPPGGPGRPPKPYRIWPLGFIAVGGGLSFCALAYYAVHTLSFEPTDGAMWVSWETKPFAAAGLAGLLLSAGALVTWLLARRRSALLAAVAPASAAAVVVAMLGVAWRVESGRHHPAAGERSIAAGLALPDAWGASRYIVTPETPPDIDPGPPRVSRQLTVVSATGPVCSLLLQAIRQWGGTVFSSISSGRSFVPGAPGCSITGSTPEGWAFYASVDSEPSGSSQVRVQVSPPGT